jgi:hypothetical protein
MEARDPVWISEDTWVCRRHMSHVRLPATSERCWYSGCSTRPPLERRIDVRPEALAPAISIVRPKPDEASARKAEGRSKSPRPVPIRVPGVLVGEPPGPSGATGADAPIIASAGAFGDPGSGSLAAPPSGGGREPGAPASIASPRPLLSAKAFSPPDRPVCAWKGCEKPARPNSKYCSRRCSNRNARSRHRARSREDRKSSVA